MAKAVVIEGRGSPEVLKIVDIASNPSLSEGQVLIENKVVGVNRLEVEQRLGLSSHDLEIPGVIGIESVGVIREIANGVHDFQVGDRVGCCSLDSGAYSQFRVVDHKTLIKLPKTMSFEIAASCMFKGINAHYLLYKVNALSVGPSVVIIHNAVDGIGYFLAQYAKYAGHIVVGTIASDDDAQAAKRFGCTHVFNYKDADFVSKIMDITKGLGVAVVYDSVGKDTARISLESLGLFGMYVIYGQSSGVSPPVSPKVLGCRSLFMTYTSVFHYKRMRFELALTATEVFKMVEKSVLVPVIDRRYSINEVKQAHEDLESNKVKGSSIIVL